MKEKKEIFNVKSAIKSEKREFVEALSKGPTETYIFRFFLIYDLFGVLLTTNLIFRK
jgi:hypothetical protein